MKVKIHHRTFEYFGGECGIYKNDTPISFNYAKMDKSLLVSAINGMSREEAILAVTQLRDNSAEQTKLEAAPQNIGFPLLRRIPEPTPIGEVRAHIENTVRFSEAILRVLNEE